MNPLYSHNGLSRFVTEVQNKRFACKVYWAKMVSSENESLFTKYTKHTFYEIQYALQGKSGFLLEEEKRLLLSPDQFTLIPPNTYHQITESDAVGARFIMAFSFEGTGLTLPKEPAVWDASPRMQQFLLLLLEKSKEDSPLTRELLDALISGFLLEVLDHILAEASQEVPPATTEGTHPLVQEALSIIKRSNGIGIGVETVAEEVGVSPRHLNRLFQEHLERTVSSAIAQQKLKKIEWLAASSSLSLNEIADLCGFADEYAMNKFFRKRTNTTLSQYRKINKK